jgi:hypothetical protein
MGAPVGKSQFGNGHAVLRQGAGLVGAQHGRGAQRFDCRPRLASTRDLRDIRSAPMVRNSVRTTGNSSGSIDMASAMPASSASSQSPRSSAVKQPGQNADAEADHREPAHHACASRR